jgi:hypothetical protein
VRGRVGQDETWSWLIVIAPGVFVVVAEGLARIATALFDAHGPVDAGLVAFLLGIGAAVVMAVALPFIREEGGIVLSMVSICASFLGLLIGYFLLFEAGLSVCTGACDP